MYGRHLPIRVFDLTQNDEPTTAEILQDMQETMEDLLSIAMGILTKEPMGQWRGK